jgi:site-specific DNA-methyltransferase (adenine-specific)/modification methylase
MRVEHIGDCTLHLGDCLEILPTLEERVDAVVTDPPYGIGESARKVRSRGTSSARVRRKLLIEYGNFDWDEKPCPPEAIALMRAASDWQIIFGGNFFELPPTSCWLVWDKLNSGDFADCELAWTNLPQAVRRLQFHWNGCMRREREIPREHPTQKPVGVMAWALGHLPAARSVVDPFMGSGTTGVACVDRGLRFTGMERDPRYFDVACRRIEEAHRQPRLFAEPRAVPRQESLPLV